MEIKHSLKTKDAYYFSHDSNAKDDPKCILLIEQLGLEGYGIFWVLVETLRSQSDFKYPLNLLPALARRYNTSSEKMKAVVLSYELFMVESESFFFSESLNRRMQLFHEKREKLSEAGKRGNAIRWRSPGDNHPIASKEKFKQVKENLLSEDLFKNSGETTESNRNVRRNYDGLFY